MRSQRGVWYSTISYRARVAWWNFCFYGAIYFDTIEQLQRHRCFWSVNCMYPPLPLCWESFWRQTLVGSNNDHTSIGNFRQSMKSRLRRRSGTCRKRQCWVGTKERNPRDGRPWTTRIACKHWPYYCCWWYDRRPCVALSMRWNQLKMFPIVGGWGGTLNRPGQTTRTDKRGRLQWSTGIDGAMRGHSICIWTGCAFLGRGCVVAFDQNRFTSSPGTYNIFHIFHIFIISFNLKWNCYQIWIFYVSFVQIVAIL